MSPEMKYGETEMSMKDGIKQWVDVSLDTKDEIAMDMIDAGVDPKQALLASTVVTKKSVSERLDQHFADKSASEITSTISSHSDRNLLN